MRATDSESARRADAERAPAASATPVPDAFSPAALAAPRDLLRLQRAVGNRAVGRMVQRKPKKDPFEEQRRMVEGPEGGKTDEPWVGPRGDRFVWDPFDRTLTIFSPEDGPNKGQAVRLTYKEGSAEELAKMAPGDMLTNVEVLSPIRAKAMEWLRTEQGTFQETEDQRSKRVTKSATEGAAARAEWAKQSPANAAALAEYQRQQAEYAQAVQDWKDKKRKTLPARKPKAPFGMPLDKRVTACNLHTGDFAKAISGATNFMGGMDPRAGAAQGKRAGAFHTLQSHPAGPKAGDILSSGAISRPTKKGGLRTANFLTTMHVGVLKSRRPGPGGTEIWTVVDGGQGTFEKRQEVRERTRLFTKERLEVSIPKLGKSGGLVGWEKDTVEMECGVFKSKLADAGQTDEDKLLRGWVDIDEYFGSGPAPAATEAGANSEVFAGLPVST